MTKYSFNGNKVKTSTTKAYVFRNHRNENQKEIKRNVEEKSKWNSTKMISVEPIKYLMNGDVS